MTPTRIQITVPPGVVKVLNLLQQSYILLARPIRRFQLATLTHHQHTPFEAVHELVMKDLDLADKQRRLA